MDVPHVWGHNSETKAQIKKLKSLADAKMLFHRKLCLIQIFFSSTWATSIFHFKSVLPFPVKICPFEICTRARAGSSLFNTKSMKNWVLVSLPVSGSEVPSVVQLCVFVVSCHAVCLAHGRVARTLAMLVQTQEASRRCSKSETAILYWMACFVLFKATLGIKYLLNVK